MFCLQSTVANIADCGLITWCVKGGEKKVRPMQEGLMLFNAKVVFEPGDALIHSNRKIK